MGFHLISTSSPDFFQGIIAEVSVAGEGVELVDPGHYFERDHHLVEECWIMIKQHPTRTRDLPLFSLMPQRIGTDWQGTLPKWDLFQVRGR